MSAAPGLERGQLAAPGTISAAVSQVGGAASIVLSALLKSPGARRIHEWPLTARIGLCFVPSGAPLLDHRSASANVHHLCYLGGRPRLSDEDVRHALRLTELPDRRLHAKAGRLEGLERLAVWLAVHRLTQSRTLVLEDPTRGLIQRSVDHLARLLREAAALPSAVVIITPDTRFATSLSDRVVMLDQTGSP